MKRVTGVGGIFFKAKDPATLGAWYKKHLGIDVQEWGGAMFNWADAGEPEKGMTVWNVSGMDDDHFAPSTSPFMINYLVADLHSLIQELRAEGCNVLDQVEESEYGKFGWVIDPEGNKIELWEAPTEQ
ncbi:MAG: VOC family protein [Caldilineaceae bacterium]